MYYRAGEEGSDQNRMVMNLGVKGWREFSTFFADVLNKKILHFEGYFAISASKVSPGLKWNFHCGIRCSAFL